MGGALYHDKIRAPLFYHLIFAVAAVAALGAAIATAMHGGLAAAVPPGLAALVLPLVWLLFSVLRISVTKGEVYVQYGLFGPKIAVDDIEHCAAVDYDWMKYGGWGIRFGRDGSVAYNMMGDKGRAVEIRYRKGKRTKKVLVASPDPERLAAAILQARAAAAGEAPAKARIEAPEAVDEARERAAEEEAAAAEGEEKKMRQG